MTDANFGPPRWLRNAHLQLAGGALLRSRRRVAYRREFLPTPDGDEILLDHAESGPEDRPRLLLLHGLEGSSYSTYVQGLAALAAARRWNVTVLNFRSCARDPGRLFRRVENRTARLYHSGETGDLGFVLDLLGRRARSPILAAGASMGGNVLLKWLGENRGAGKIRAAAAISTPYDLLACARHLERGAGPVYTSVFLRTLKPKAFSVLRRFPPAAERIDREKLERARTFFDFDDAATAPLHGFTGAADYYARSSSIGFLPRIDVPTLCVTARNDPFLPEEAVERARAAASPAVDFRVTASGSHLGFPEGPPWALRSWAESAVVAWLEARLG
ncbi:MAG TPA: alpha/beta fold hydrolase [Thermoanaerobaculia bacterium]|nr:alpha/beta fold hydrolase [Thermoanaerobaculia bacterium]